MRAEVDTETINTQTVIRTYARWAPVYDLVFGTVFERARHAAIAATNRVGGRVLDVGVGTGICLPHYAPTTRVVGVDLSEPMLRKAHKRVAEQGLYHVERLEVMDAERLAFSAASFDVVVAQYVVNTVPHPEIALDEFARVLKPGGEIILINRVGAEQGPRRTLEHLFMPVTQKLGWRTLGRPLGRYAPHRAQPGAAARPLLADPFRQDRDRGGVRSRGHPRCRLSVAASA
jgi:phosphatidylethanolamine/phosphatidyl-N-methylethanolamine N-methyltransferase